MSDTAYRYNERRDIAIVSARLRVTTDKNWNLIIIGFLGDISFSSIIWVTTNTAISSKYERCILCQGIMNLSGSRG